MPKAELRCTLGFCAALAASPAIAAPLGEALFWWSPVSDAVYRHDLETGLTTEVIANHNTGAVGAVTDLAIDSRNRRLFWFNRQASSDSFRLWTAGVDGSGVTQLPITSTGVVQALCLDADRGYIYWHDRFHSQIRRADLAGQNESVVYANVSAVGALTIDTATETLYWSLVPGQRIDRGRADGSGREQFLALNFPEAPISMTVDERGRRLLFNGGQPPIHAATIDDVSPIRTVLYHSDTFSEDIAFDPGDGSIYWTVPGGPLPSDRVERLAPGSTNAELLFTGFYAQPRQLAILLVPAPGVATLLLGLGTIAVRRRRTPAP